MIRPHFNKNNFISWFSIVILLARPSFIQTKLHKCCQTDSNIVVHGNTVVNCVKSENSSTLDAYNVESLPTQSLFPSCKYNVQMLFPQSQNTFMELNGCIDRSADGQFYALTCSEQATVGVHKINKCCSNGVYDHAQRFCVRDLRSIQHFERLFDGSVIVFENKVPECNDNEAFVEYYSTAHAITFDQKKLRISAQHLPFVDILESDRYCVEGLINTKSNELDQHIIVRTCRPRSICQKIPCIRRCCKTDQILTRNNTEHKAECVQHPNNANIDPNFYDLNFPVKPNETQQGVHLKGLFRF